MKNIRRMIVTLLVFAMSLSLVACGGGTAVEEQNQIAIEYVEKAKENDSAIKEEKKVIEKSVAERKTVTQEESVIEEMAITKESVTEEKSDTEESVAKEEPVTEEIKVIAVNEMDRKQVLLGDVSLTVNSIWSKLSDETRNEMQSLFDEYIPSFKSSEQETVIKSGIFNFVNQFMEICQREEVYELLEDGNFELNYIISGDVNQMLEILHLQGFITQDKQVIDVAYVLTNVENTFLTQRSYDLSKYISKSESYLGYFYVSTDYVAKTQTIQEINYTPMNDKYEEIYNATSPIGDMKPQTLTEKYMKDGRNDFVETLFQPIGEEKIVGENIIQNNWVNLDDTSKQKFVAMCEEALPLLKTQDPATILTTEWCEFTERFVQLCLQEGVVAVDDKRYIEYEMIHLVSGEIGGAGEYVMLTISYGTESYTVSGHYTKTSELDKMLEASYYRGSYVQKTQKYHGLEGSFYTYNYDELKCYAYNTSCDDETQAVSGSVTQHDIRDSLAYNVVNGSTTEFRISEIIRHSVVMDDYIQYWKKNN